MKKILLPTLVLLASFCFGFAFKSIIGSQPNQNSALKRVGGIFFKCKDLKKLRDWYQTILDSIQTNMDLFLNFGKVLTQVKKDFRNGALLAKRPNILNPQRKSL